MAKRQESLTELLRRVHADAAKQYRTAISLQMEGAEATSEWDRWEADTAALLLAAWATGAKRTVQQAGIPAPAVRATFDRNAPEVAMEFRPGPAREIVQRYSATLPITRARWNALMQAALEAARELRRNEEAEGLTRLLERSPDLARVVQGLPLDVLVRRTPEAKKAAQGSFFVTGMTQAQIEETRALLAKAVRGEVTTSVAGKRLKTLGVGDFAGLTVLRTGTDLTEARLETVFRTNLNRAQTQGQLDIVREPTVQAFVPVMRFSSTRDARTRDTHRAMDGFVATVEQIDAQGIATPAGFNCRCAWVAVPAAQAMSSGWTKGDGTPDLAAIKRHNGRRQSLIDTGKFPDPGFVSG